MPRYIYINLFGKYQNLFAANVGKISYQFNPVYKAKATKDVKLIQIVT